MKSERFECRIGTGSLARLDALARAAGIDRSSIVRGLIARAYTERFGEVDPPQAAVQRAAPAALPRKAAGVHELLTGSAPGTRALQLYESYPQSHGIDTAQPTDDEVDACIVLGLVQALGGRRPVIVLEPDHIKAAVSSRLHACTSNAFGALGDYPASVRGRLAVELGEAFRSLCFGVPHTWPDGPPYSWVAVGMSGNDKSLPTWLRNALLDSQDDRRTEVLP